MLNVRNAILIMIASAAIALVSCAPPEPIRIGFLGGLSGRASDLGIGGLNGVRLAVELRNKAGGIKGRLIELIEADDQQDPEVARQAFATLIKHRVAAVVGPMTSAMAMPTVTLANQARLLMLSPTVTTNDLSGLDDYFFRVLPETGEFARTSAHYYFRTLGLHRVLLVYDLRNSSYTESWLKDFSKAFAEEGGKVLDPIGFNSSDETNFAALAREALSGKPDGIIVLGNSVDAAMLCQSIRRLDSSIALGTSEWAATERLAELGGRSVEGITVAQLFDRQSTQPAYVAFRAAFLARFRLEPGFAGIFGFDAANIIFTALEQKAPEQSLKQAILAQKTFAGVQNPISFDANGDTRGGTFMVSIKNGAFVPPGSAP